MKPYLTECSEVLSELQTGAEGLSSQEAGRRLAQSGPNKLKEAKKVSLLARFLKELADPMIIILIAAAAVSGITALYSGESFADVIIILAVVIINAVLGVVQENKAEKAIAALQEIAAATSKVIRDGHITTVRSEELVPGDIIILEAGDAVPADARIIECASMKVEESALTGESVPVEKTDHPLTLGAEKDIPLGDRKNMVYMGSTVVYGRGRAVLTGTGMNTEMGKIADALIDAKDDATPLQRKLNQLSKILSVLVIGICLVIFALDLFRAYPNISGETVLDTFMIAVSLAVAAIPEGLAAVVTIVLSMGVTRMSRRNAVIRKLTAVETLGCTQIICSDKTGTLTQNKMTVVDHSCKDLSLLVTAMALCSDAEQDNGGDAVGEPTECALVNDSAAQGLPKDSLIKEYPRIGEAPFDSMRKMMSTVHKKADGSVIQFTKGAPDEVLKRCTSLWDGERAVPLTDALRNEILEANKAMADQALRVLSGAMRLWDQEPESYEAAYLETELCFLGLSGMIDPIRPSYPGRGKGHSLRRPQKHGLHGKHRGVWQRPRRSHRNRHEHGNGKDRRRPHRRQGRRHPSPEEVKPAQQDLKRPGDWYLPGDLRAGSVPGLPQYLGRDRPGYLYDRRQPGRGRHPRGSGRRGHHRPVHGRHQNVQAERGHQKADRRGNPGLHPDHLLR